MASEGPSEVTRLTDENMILMKALVEIAQDSEEADIVRTAVAALQRTASGVEYLSMNHLVI